MKSPVQDRDHPSPAVILDRYAGQVDSVDYRWTLPDGTQSAMTIRLRPPTQKDAA